MPNPDTQTSATDARALLDQLQIAVLLVDSELQLQWLNAAAEALLVISLPAVCGCPLEMLFSAQDLPLLLARTLTEDRSFTRTDAQLQYNGRQRQLVDYSTSPMRMDDGQKFLLLEMSKSRPHQPGISARDDQRMANELSQVLARSLAHEIRTPLASIRGAAQLLEDPLAPDHEIKLNIILREVDRLSTLAETMLGQVTPPRYQRFNIHEITEHCVQLIDARDDCELEIERRYDPSLPPIEGDRDQLLQVLLNITNNAIEAMQQRSDIRPHLRLSTGISLSRPLPQQRRSNALCIAIENNGPPIPTQLHDTLFLPLITGRARGTGLGLAIVRSTVHQHGGLVEFSSDEQLTRFSILLPFDQPPP